MRKDVLLKLVLLVMLFIGMFTACDDDEKVKVGNPDVAFNTETGEYRVKVGKEVLLQANGVGCHESPVFLEIERENSFYGYHLSVPGGAGG